MTTYLTIYTYGHLDAMLYVLSAIAMITNSKISGMIIKAVAMIATFYYVTKASYSSAQTSPKPVLAKIAAMILVINALLIPTTTMTIVDKVNKTRDRVENIPLGFAIPVGMMEQVGNLLTMMFEQAFQVPGSNNTNYSDYGMVFGARLIQESRNWRIKNPEFSINMDNFIMRCVALDASIAHKYTINDLLESTDVWSLIKKKSSNFRKVAIKDRGKASLKTCKEAAVILDDSFKSEIEKLTDKYATTEFGSSGNISSILVDRSAITIRSNFFKKNVDIVFAKYIEEAESAANATSSATSRLRQYMMMNSMSSFAKTYGYARSAMTQENNWRISSDLASKYLPLLLSVMKGMIYASFIFMMPLMLLSGGVSKYLSYIAIVASLQLWPSLNAILNMFIDLYSSSQMHQITSSGGVSFTNYSRIADYSDTIVAVASGLQMVIPYLAFSLVQGGVTGFINLASTITSASSAASSMVAQEVTTNNKSFDNYSEGNIQRAMQQGFKTDLNSSFKQGVSEIQNRDGSIERILENGETIIQSGVGMNMSGGSVKFASREGLSNQISSSLQDNKSQLTSLASRYNESQRSTFSKTASFLSNLAKRESQGETFDYSSSGEEGVSLQKTIGEIQTLQRQYGYGYEQVSNMILSAGIDVSVSKSAGNTGDSISGKAGVNLGGGFQATNNSSQRLSDDSSVSEDKRASENYNAIVRAASSEQFASSNNIDKSYSDDIRSSFEAQKSAEMAMNIQYDKVQSLTSALSLVESMDSSTERDMYHKVQNALASKYGISRREAHQMIELGDPRVTKVFDGILQIETSNLVNSQIRASRSKFNDANQGGMITKDYNQHHVKIKTDNYSHNNQVLDKSHENSINPEDKNFVQNNIKQEVDDFTSQAQRLQKEAIQENRQVQEVLQSKVNKREGERYSKNMWIGDETNPSTLKKK